MWGPADHASRRRESCAIFTRFAHAREDPLSPILVRPVREQLEHDRVIRLLQAKYKRKFEVAINPGHEQTMPVPVGTSPWYPDLVLQSTDRGRKLLGTVEVETAESVNNLEAMSQWAAFSKLRAPFHLYVPASTSIPRSACARTSRSRRRRSGRTTRSAIRCGSRWCSDRPRLERLSQSRAAAARDRPRRAAPARRGPPRPAGSSDGRRSEFAAEGGRQEESPRARPPHERRMPARRGRRSASRSCRSCA